MSPNQIDFQDPRRILEAAEEHEEFITPYGREVDRARYLRQVLAWVLEAKTLIAISTRCYVAAYVGAPDVVSGMTLHQIAALSGKGRTATHNLAREFEQVFNVKSIHGRSEEARKKYSAAYHRRNGSRPHTYNPKS